MDTKQFDPLSNMLRWLRTESQPLEKRLDEALDRDAEVLVCFADNDTWGSGLDFGWFL